MANMSEEERLAAEWAALACDEDDDSHPLNWGGSTRVLNQWEIDSLLGFDDDDLEYRRKQEEKKLRVEVQHIRDSWNDLQDAISLFEKFIYFVSQDNPVYKILYKLHKNKRHIEDNDIWDFMKDTLFAEDDYMNPIREQYPEITKLELKIKELDENYKILIALTREV